MPGLIGAWRTIRRFVRQQVEAQRNLELAAQKAMRKDRRAERKALSLLMSLLNPEQRQEFRECRRFHVTGGSSHNRYRIRVGMIANIDVLDDDGKVKYRLCVTPAGGVPVYDVMAAQLLHLQDCVTEEQLLRQANVHPAIPEDRACSRLGWIV
jgi:hypothetical protein